MLFILGQRASTPPHAATEQSWLGGVCEDLFKLLYLLGYPLCNNNMAALEILFVMALLWLLFLKGTKHGVAELVR